jgi:hypothetical protein
MDKSLFKKILPYLVAIILFIAIDVIYFYPIIEGKRLLSSDTSSWKGMSKELVDYHEKTGEYAQWTNSMFSGMPAYQIYGVYKGNLTWLIDQFLFRLDLPQPMDYVFLYFLGFFILLLILKVDPWLSIAGSIAFGFSTYFFNILLAGHLTKAQAIGYMAPVLGGVILAYRGKYLWGAVLTALFLALEIRTGHPQITYYLLITVLGLGIAELIYAFKEKQIIHFLKATGVLAAAGIIAVLTSTGNLWTTYEYSKYSNRGESELTFNKANQTSGLDKDYATAWSYGISETMTLLIPDFQGGSSVGSLSENSETYKVLIQNNIPNTKKIVKQLPLYWGKQPFMAGPVYIGAIICFLFVFGLFVVKGRMKWWLLAITLLSIMLAWGKNFMFLTNFFLEHFPAYNKFRAVSMTLVIAELTMPLLAFIAMQKIFDKGHEINKILKALRISYFIVGGITLVFIILPGAFFNFSGPMDVQYGFPDWLLQALQADRLSMLRMDAIRSFVFISLSYLLLWAYIKNKVKKPYAFILLIALVLIDMWPVAKRYLNNDDFVRKSLAEKPFNQTKADSYILKDKTLYYRVFDLTEDIDKSARTSYFHKNIGGYHGAKLRRYQELVDYQVSNEKEQFVTLLNNRPTNLALNLSLVQNKVLNMLNARYYIYSPDADALINYNALGNAWFVPDYKLVENADLEITALNDFDPKRTAIVNKQFRQYLNGFTKGADTTGFVKLTDYKPDKLTYSYKTSKDQLTVFSDIYYEKGWKAFVDGKLTPHFRANYVLRAMVLPAGEHTLIFEFRPKSYYLGEKISLISSLFLLIVIAGMIGREVYNYSKKNKLIR